MATAAAMRGVPYTLVSAATTGNGNVAAIPVSFHYHQIIIKGAGGVASGAVQVEASDDPDYTGTWAQIGGGPTTVVDVTELAINFTGSYSFVRARVSTVVAGGTVTCTYRGQP